jgi:hypothetical protein
MKRAILFLFLSSIPYFGKCQVYTAGSALPVYVNINPDTVMHYVYFPYTTQIYDLNVFGNLKMEFMAKGSSSSGGSIALINVKPLDPHVFISFGRLDSIFDSTSTSWLVTKVAKPLLQGDPINDPTAVWDNTLQYLTDKSASFGWTKNVTDWVGGDKYLGLKYQNGNATGYGWIRVQCPDADSCYIKDVSYATFTTGLKELDKDKLAIFPNPTQTKFTVSVDPFLKVEELCVYNINGKCVWRNKSTSSNQVVDLANQPNGVYFLQLRTLNGFLTHKIVKE